MRTAVWVVVVVAAAVLDSAPAAADDGWVEVDRVVAVVNRDVILSSDVDRRLAGQAKALAAIADPAERARRRAELARTALDAMVGQQLVLQVARDAGVTIAAAEVDAAIEQVKQSNQIDDAGLASALAEAGYTIDQYRQEIEQQIMQLRVVNVILRPRLYVSEADVRKAWEETRRREPGTGAYAEVKAALRELLTEQALAAEQGRWLAELRANAYVDVRTP
jgi:parvulin-like peptidyl-prolyl isomerase